MTSPQAKEEEGKHYFVSGHLDLSPEEFKCYYQSQLQEAAAKPGSLFVIGSAPRGADVLALEYLLTECKVDPRRITIFVFSKHPDRVKALQSKCNDQKVNVRLGFSSDDQRDAALTYSSDADIAWVRSAEQMRLILGKKYKSDFVCGTQQNLNRRKRNQWAEKLHSDLDTLVVNFHQGKQVTFPDGKLPEEKKRAYETLTLALVDFLSAYPVTEGLFLLLYLFLFVLNKCT
jgi:hypothetical protein